MQMLKYPEMSAIGCLKEVKVKELETHPKTFDERLEELNYLRNKVQELLC